MPRDDCSPLPSSASTALSASSVLMTNSGGGATVTIRINTRDNRYGNLDAGFQLIDVGSLTEIASVLPSLQRDASWTGTLASGNYKIHVFGTGNPSNGDDQGYSNYGSLGQYQVLVTGLSTPTPTTASPTTVPPTTAAPTIAPPTTASPTIAPPPTATPTTVAPTTVTPSVTPTPLPTLLPTQLPCSSS